MSAFSVHFYPLQSLKVFEVEVNPLNVAAFVVFLVLLIGLFIYLNVSKRVAKSSIMNESILNNAPKRIPKNAGFQKILRAYRFSPEEKSFLNKAFQKSNQNPAEIFRDPQLLDNAFEELYRDTRRNAESPEESEKLLTLLFSIRNTIDYYQRAEEVFDEKRNYVIRRYRRKQYLPAQPCVCTPVKEVHIQENKGAKVKLVPENRHFKGGLLNLSIGGCALQTGEQMNVGDLLKVEFIVARATVAVLGQALHINQSKGMSVLHVRFLTVPPKAKNTLNAYLFDYGVI